MRSAWAPKSWCSSATRQARFDRDGHLLANLGERRIEELCQGGAIDGPVRLRLEAASAAVASGVHSAHIIDGRRLHALLLEVLSGSSEGTMVLPDRSDRFVGDSRRYME